MHAIEKVEMNNYPIRERIRRAPPPSVGRGAARRRAQSCVGATLNAESPDSNRCGHCAVHRRKNAGYSISCRICFFAIAIAGAMRGADDRRREGSVIVVPVVRGDPRSYSTEISVAQSRRARLISLKRHIL